MKCRRSARKRRGKGKTELGWEGQPVRGGTRMNEYSHCLLKIYGGVTIDSQCCDNHQLVEYTAM